MDASADQWRDGAKCTGIVMDNSTHMSLLNDSCTVATRSLQVEKDPLRVFATAIFQTEFLDQFTPMWNGTFEFMFSTHGSLAQLGQPMWDGSWEDLQGREINEQCVWYVKDTPCGYSK